MDKKNEARGEVNHHMNRTNLLLVIIFLSAAFFCATTGIASAITLSDKYVGNTVVDLEWSKYGSTNFSKYKLYRNDALIHTEFNRHNTFYRDEGPSKGNKYNYKIKVYNALGGLVDTSTKKTVTAGEVHGTITQSTTWTAATSPYGLTGTVIVDECATLTIQPGVTVNTGLYMIDIKGTITPLDTVTFNGEGLVLRDVDGFSIKNCVFDGATGGGFGIALDRCNNGIISGTVVKNYASRGIYLSGDNNRFTNITASNNFDGIILDGDNNTLTGSTTSNNGGNGIYLSRDNNMLSDNIASNNGGSGICLSGDNNMFTGSTASNNGGNGIYLSGDNNTLSDNIASNNGGSGICLSGDNNMLTKNIANSNDYGIYLECSNNNRLQSNTASENYYGLRLHYSSYNTLTKNTANSNDNGIYLLGDNNMLTSNTVNSNKYGIRLRSSNNNTLTNNTISNNSYFGIHLMQFSGHNVINNNLIVRDTTKEYSYSIVEHEAKLNVFKENTVGLVYPTKITVYDYNGFFKIRGVEDPPKPPEPPEYPITRQSISKYVEIQSLSADTTLWLDFHYEDKDVEDIDEESLKVWKHNSTGWDEGAGNDSWNGTRKLDTPNNIVGVEVLKFCILAPLAGLPVHNINTYEDFE